MLRRTSFPGRIMYICVRVPVYYIGMCMRVYLSILEYNALGYEYNTQYAK